MNYSKEISQYIQKKYDLQDLKENDYLFTTGVIDSFGIVELIADLESQYGIQFKADDLKKENLETVSAIAKLITAKKNDWIHTKRISTRS